MTLQNLPSLLPARPVLSWTAKLAFTAFMAVLVPVYWREYGPTNFLYFCDLALFMTLAAVWTERPIFASMAAVGILMPQALWCVDFGLQVFGVRFLGMTAYMFDPARPLFLRGLSFFHGWLPFFLVFLVCRLGYDRRALRAWTCVAWGAMLVSYLFLPRPGVVLPNPKAPVNINYVYGLSDASAQTWMPEAAWLVLMFVGLPVLIYLPTHLLLRRSGSKSSTLSSARV